MGPVERDENVHEVRSPLVGTFYRVPAPGEKPYVEVGDRIEAGRVLCFVEAMEPAREAVPDLHANYYSGEDVVGVHHEAVAVVSGEAIEVLIGEAGEVERGRPLFRLRPGA